MEPTVFNVDCNIMVFKPTIEEFANFSEYVKYMESKGAHKAGIAKIIPPKGWVAAKQYNMKKIGEMVIETPVAQTVTGHQGLFQLFNVQKKSLKVKEFIELAESSRYKGPTADENCVDDKVERQYWKNITFNQPIYGADVPGSVYDTDVEHWNISRLGTILDLMGTNILGVNTPYLYFGMWKTTFPWHTEDMDLYSINYLHFGAPKSWYAISPEQGKRLETLAKGFFSGSFHDCSQFMRHKMTIISPHVLKKFSIPVQKITQYEGEFMVTFPYGYHSGYNHGFNCAESTNFGSERWIEFGKKAKYCQCKPDSVKIDMDIFIRKYQPDEWKRIQQERRKDEDIDIHNKRKTARANYSSESSPLKLKVFTGRKNGYGLIKKKIEYKLDKSEEEINSDEDGSTSDDSDETTDSEDSSSDDQGESFENNDAERHPDKVKTKTKLQCNYNRDMHKKEVARKMTNQCSRRYISAIHKKIHKKSTTNKDKKESSVSTYHTSHLLKDLWSYMGPNKNCERSFNEMLSYTEARCAVCVYFSQNDSNYLHRIQSSKLNADKQSKEGSHHGKLLVTELCFAMDNSEENSIETAFNLMFGNVNNSEELSLLTCVECNISVHNSCYGVYDHDKSTDWYCDKCKFLNSYYEKLKITDSVNCDKYLNNCLDSIKCSLCCIRAGALKETTTGGWCHIVCAVAIPEVFFRNKKDRGPIDISSLNPARRNLNCLYCSHLSKSPSNRGACIQCKCGKCATSFHVTCNFHHGIPLYLGDWPVCVETLCPKHSKFKVVTKVEKRSLAEVATDDLVFAKHKNGRYYRGKVIDKQQILYYKVVFDDKSFCFDLPPDDIQGVDAKTNIIPPGEVVDILWPDSMTYRAEVTGHWYEMLCQIRFEDGSILHVKRCDFYVDGEEIPKKIQSKLSYASETKNKFYLPASMNSASKRPRVESWRYKNKDGE